MAYRLASQTVLGSGQLVRDSGIHPGKLKDDVTSPAGSTASGLCHLEANGKTNKIYALIICVCVFFFLIEEKWFYISVSAFRSTVAGAVESATKRCREIAEKNNCNIK